MLSQFSISIMFILSNKQIDYLVKKIFVKMNYPSDGDNFPILLIKLRPLNTKKWRFDEDLGINKTYDVSLILKSYIKIISYFCQLS